jgi:hypothetical protein
MAVTCLKCSAQLEKPVAGISTCPMGDEIIHSYYLCAACDVWTVEFFLDRFMGDTFARLEGPYPRASGDADVAKIRRCPTPHDKMCDCDVHRAWH